MGEISQVGKEMFKPFKVEAPAGTGGGAWSKVDAEKTSAALERIIKELDKAIEDYVPDRIFDLFEEAKKEAEKIQEIADPKLTFKLKAHLSRLIQKAQDVSLEIGDFKSAMGELGVVQKEKSWEEMDAYELAEYLSSVIYASDDINNAKNRFTRLVSEIENPHERKMLEVRVLVQELIVEGDSGQKDFSVWFNSIIERYITKGMSFIDVVRAYFLIGDKNETNFDKLKINENAINIWDYMVKRIKGRYADDIDWEQRDLLADGDEELGIPENKEIDRFAYPRLSDDRVDEFIEDIKNKFKHVPEKEVMEIVKWAQSHDIKTTGYIPWLAEETTRSHGTAIAAQKGEKLKDACFTCAPEAANVYSRGRYGLIIPNATSSNLIWYPEGMYADLIPKKALKYNKKVEAANSLWEIVNEYHEKILWNGHIPEWVTQMREMMGIKDAPLAIFNSWFPLPGDHIVDQVKIEKQKKELLNSPDFGSQESLEKLREFYWKNIRLVKDDPKKKEKVDGWASKEEWAKAFGAFGIGSLGLGNPKNYDLAFDAYSKMLEFFYDPVGRLNYDQAMAKFEWWRNKCVGKAKLAPGRHHLTFVPFTLRAIDKIIDAFDGSSDAREIRVLLSDMLENLGGADGLPKSVQIEVEESLRKDSRYIGLFDDPLDRTEYVDKLHKFIYQHTEEKTMEYKLGRLDFLGITGAKKDKNRNRLGPVKPWSWKEKADKDTSK